MKQKEVLRKIGVIINELNEQYEYFQTADEEINDLEVELFTANANFLTDHIEIFRKLNFQNNNAKKPVEKQENVQQEKYFEPVVQQVKPIVPEPKPPVEPEPVIQSTYEERPVPQIDLSSDTAEDTYSYIRQEPETIRHELILDDSINWDEEDEDLPVENEPLASDYEEPETQPLIEAVTEPEAIETEQLIAKEPVEEEPVEEIKEPEPVIEEPVTFAPVPPVAEEPVIEEPAFEHYTFEEPVVEEPVIEEPVIFAPAPPVAEEVKPANVLHEVKAEKPATDDVLTINQKISGQLAEKNPHTEQTIKPISDIKQAITLNDKLLFVKDLFNGYSLAYSEAIEILNRFKTYEEANRFLDTNYAVKNKWDTKPDTTEKFYSLLRRRYA